MLAGRSPSYLVRQLFDLKTHHRHGQHTDQMEPVVAKLSTDDMLAIAAYLASLPPPERPQGYLSARDEQRRTTTAARVDR